MQLAYFKLYKKYGFNVASSPQAGNQCDNWPATSPSTTIRPGCCYETAMTRKFYHGRTETMRPCTAEALKWCTAMTDPSCDVCWCWDAGVDEDDSGALTQSGFCFRTMWRGKTCCWPLRNTTSWWPKPRKDKVSSRGSLFIFISLVGEWFWVFPVLSWHLPVQALTGTFSASIWSPKRKDVRLQNSS